MENNTSKRFLSPLCPENPLLILGLGILPALGVTTSFEASLLLGASALVVLFLSNLILAGIRHLIPSHVRIPASLIVLATLVGILSILYGALFPKFESSYGIYLSLLVVDGLLLSQAELSQGDRSFGASVLEGLGSGIGYAWAVIFLGFVREVLGTGMLTFGKVFSKATVTILKGSSFNASIPFFSSVGGGLVLLGLVLGIALAIKQAAAAKKAAKGGK